MPSHATSSGPGNSARACSTSWREVAVVAGREVGEHEPPGARLPGHPGGLARRRVHGLLGPRLLRVAERGVVDEQVGPPRGLHGPAAGPGVAGHDDRPAAPGRLDHLAGLDDAAVRERHRRAALQRAEERPLRNAERHRLLQVEAPGALVLHERPAERGRSVVGLERHHRAAVPPHGLAGPHLVDPHLEGEPLGAREEHHVEEPARRARPEHVERRLAPEHGERAQEADGAEVVVGVEVREEDRVHVEAGAVADHLPLRALPAVHEEELALAPHREAAEVPPDGRLGRRGAEEGEAQHGSPAM